MINMYYIFLCFFLKLKGGGADMVMKSSPHAYMFEALQHDAVHI